MGSLAEIAARRAAPTAAKVAGAATPAPVAKPSTTTAPKREAAPAAPAAKTAPSAKPAAPAAAPTQAGQRVLPTPTGGPQSMPLMFVDEAAAETSAAEAAKRDLDAESKYYAQKLNDVARRRKEGVIGPVPRQTPIGPITDISTLNAAAPGAAVVSRSASISRPAAGKPGMPGFNVFPRAENVYTPGEDTLSRIGTFADEAKRLGQEYRAANRAVLEGEDKIAAALQDRDFDRRTLPEMAAAQRELVRRLAERRASLREMGFVDDAEVDAQFLK